MRPVAGKRRARLILPGLYLAFATYAWADFANTNHDGLANVGLFLVTLPVTLLDLALGSPCQSRIDPADLKPQRSRPRRDCGWRQS